MACQGGRCQRESSAGISRQVEMGQLTWLHCMAFEGALFPQKQPVWDADAGTCSSGSTEKDCKESRMRSDVAREGSRG